jgi:NADH dehydrogenase
MAAAASLKRAGFQVMILDANLYSTFQPLLYQVATAGLNPGDVSHPVGASARRYRAKYRRGELAAIDTAARQAKLADGREFGYDYLIIATGMTASYFGIKGAAENTCGLYTRKDAIVLRDHFMAGIERLSSDEHREFNVTVVGGGATGVELAGALSELRAVVLRSTFPDVDPDRLHVRLVEMAPSLLAPFPERLQGYTLAQLRKRGVEVLLNTRIDEVAPGRVVLGSGDSTSSDLTVWAAGVAAPQAVAGWGLPQGKHGRIVVGPDLRVQGQDRIFAVGDIAINPDDPVPQTAQPAIQMGKHAAKQILRLQNAQPTEPFSYFDKGDMATIGRKSAVVRLRHGPQLRGSLAWLAWLALHLFYLLGLRNRVTTLINLSWRYLAWGHGGAVIVGDEPEETIQQ